MMSAKRSRPPGSSPSPHVLSKAADGSRPHTSGPGPDLATANREANVSGTVSSSRTPDPQPAAIRADLTNGRTLPDVALAGTHPAVKSRTHALAAAPGHITPTCRSRDVCPALKPPTESTTFAHSG